MPMSILDHPRLSIRQAADKLGVHPTTVWRWITDGVDGRQLPSIRIGVRRFVLVRDLDQFISELQEGAAP